MDLRIKDHPILGKDDRTQLIKIQVDGTEIDAYKGEPIAVALLAAGIKVLRWTKKQKEPRGIFCAIGLCTDCVMTVNGMANIRTCITQVEEGMNIQAQVGLGHWEDDTTDG